MMNLSFPKVLLAFLGFIFVLHGCNCDPEIDRNVAVIEVLDNEGKDRTLVDFGSVQVNLTYETKLRIRNAGVVTLVIEKFTTAAPFQVKTPTPIYIEPADVTEVRLAYSPTVADKREEGTLRIDSNDRNNAQLSIDLKGVGIQAVLVPTPNPIAFGDVYLGESKKIALRIANAGSNTLDILSANFSSEVPQAPVMIANLSSLVGSVKAGEAVTTELTFAPNQRAEISGELELKIPSEQGPSIRLSLSGRGIQALPRACFQFDDEATPKCTDPLEASPNLQVRFGSLCDSRIYPVDGGQPGSCTPTNSVRSGKVWFENVGNFPVSYAMQYTPYPHANNRCDGGTSFESDFTFSNAQALADGGMPAQYLVGTQALPSAETQPRPWKTQEVAVSYQAKSTCRTEASDLARIVWTRQGDPVTRTPSLIMIIFDGASKLPYAVPSDWKCGAPGNPQSTPCLANFYGVNNIGAAPLSVTKVDLKWESSDPTFGGTHDAGTMQNCSASPALDSVCARFAWDGGTPSSTGPHLVPEATSPGTPTQKSLGTLVFAPRGGGVPPTDPLCTAEGRACAGQLYTLFADVETDDPYNPVVRVKVQGVSSSAP